MGMFSALQKKSPHATICILSCKTRAQKNRTGEFLHKIEELKRDALIRYATQCARREAAEKSSTMLNPGRNVSSHCHQEAGGGKRHEAGREDNNPGRCCNTLSLRITSSLSQPLNEND